MPESSQADRRGVPRGHGRDFKRTGSVLWPSAGRNLRHVHCLFRCNRRLNDENQTAHAAAEQTHRLLSAAVAVRAHGFSAPQIGVLFAAFMLLISIPIWTHPLPPLSDYVNHLARMHVIATLSKNTQLAHFYEIDWQVIPNLTMDLIVPLLARVMNVYLAGQVFIVGMFALIISGLPGAQPRADRPLVGVPAVRLSAALQLRLPGRIDELHFRHRRRACGRWPAGSRCASAPGPRASRCRRCACWRYSSAISRRSAFTASACSRSNLRGCGSGGSNPGRPASSILSPAACRSSPPCRCSWPARPCSLSAPPIGTSTARSTG